jgi:HSP20 family protein
VKADLPGVEKKDIKVNVEGDVLSISHEKAGKKEDKKEENGVKYHVRPFPSFEW